MRIWAGASAAVFVSLAVGSIAVPLVQHSASLASATRLQDGTLAAADLGALDDPPSGTPTRASDLPSAGASGVVAFGDGATVSITRFDGGSKTESSLELRGQALDLALSPAGDLLVVVDSTGTLSLIDIAAPSATEIRTAGIDVGAASEAAVAISADGAFGAVAAGDADQILLLDRDSGRVRAVDVGLPISELASGPSSTVYALADAAMVVVDAAEGGIVRSVAAPTGETTGIALVENGESLAVWSEDRMLLLDPISLDAVASYDPADPVFGVADGSTDGTITVGIGGQEPRVALVDLGSGATLSEIAFDVRAGGTFSPPAFGAGGATGTLFLATPAGAVTGSWDASRVAWPAWWATAVALALLAGICAIVALSADRLSASLHRNAIGALRTRVVEDRVARAVAGREATAVREPAPRPVGHDEIGASSAPPPHPPSEAPAGRIEDRMVALGFSTSVPAGAQRVIEIVRSEADMGSGVEAELIIDKVFDDGGVAGSLSRFGDRIATFVLWLSPVPSGGTRALFRVEWYVTSRATALGIPVGPKDSIAYGPLRDFATRLAARLEEEHR